MVSFNYGKSHTQPSRNWLRPSGASGIQLPGAGSCGLAEVPCAALLGPDMELPSPAWKRLAPGASPCIEASGVAAWEDTWDVRRWISATSFGSSLGGYLCAEWLSVPPGNQANFHENCFSMGLLIVKAKHGSHSTSHVKSSTWSCACHGDKLQRVPTGHPQGLYMMDLSQTVDVAFKILLAPGILYSKSSLTYNRISRAGEA